MAHHRALDEAGHVTPNQHEESGLLVFREKKINSQMFRVLWLRLVERKNHKTKQQLF